VTNGARKELGVLPGMSADVEDDSPWRHKLGN
jgi:hypothetical protein